MDLLTPAAGTSFCEWKGVATYWTARAGGRVSQKAAWSYEKPTPAFAAIRGHIAFYATRVDECWVDDEQVEPQPGNFYGGWITSEITGPFKS